jgi:hypothetical protein
MLQHLVLIAGSATDGILLLGTGEDAGLQVAKDLSSPTRSMTEKYIYFYCIVYFVLKMYVYKTIESISCLRILYAGTQEGRLRTFSTPNAKSVY